MSATYSAAPIASDFPELSTSPVTKSSIRDGSDVVAGREANQIGRLGCGSGPHAINATRTRRDYRSGRRNLKFLYFTGLESSLDSNSPQVCGRPFAAGMVLEVVEAVV